jgi:hypothetical protein
MTDSDDRARRSSHDRFSGAAEEELRRPAARMSSDDDQVGIPRPRGGNDLVGGHSFANEFFAFDESRKRPMRSLQELLAFIPMHRVQVFQGCSEFACC